MLPLRVGQAEAALNVLLPQVARWKNSPLIVAYVNMVAWFLEVFDASP